MTEQEMKARAKKRQERKRKRMQRVRLMRTILFIGILVLCVGTGILVSRTGKSSREAKSQPVVGAVQTMAAVETGGETDVPRETAAFLPKRTEVPEIGTLYGIYINGAGWSNYFAGGTYAMAPVDGYVTAIRGTLHNQPSDMSGTIEYAVNLSGNGWLDWVEDASEAGKATGEMPLEAIRVRLTGELAEYYDILYCVLQDNKWTKWVENGADAGESGVGLRVDGIQMSVVKKQDGQESFAGNIDPSKPMIALTYDDGPSASNTPRILNTLKSNGARATFFMVGKQAAKNPAIVKQMVEQGNEVANHTYDHTFMNKVDATELTRQLVLTNQTVSDASGVSPVLMRPCGGIRNEVGVCAIGSISMPLVMWSIDTLDWKTRDAQNTVDTVLREVKDGDIILLHDLYDTTAEASEQLIPKLIDQGYQLVTVSELASYRGGMLPGKSYSRFRPLQTSEE